LHLVAAAGLLLLAACGDDSVAPAPDSGAEAGADAFTPYDASLPDSGPCNALVLTAPPTTDHVVTDAQAPVPDGGTIAPGLYFLTDTSVYLVGDAGAPPLGTRREVHSFDDAGLWQTLTTSDDGGATRLALAVAAEGVTLHRVVICPPDIKSKDGEFTASGTSLSLFDYNGGVVTVFTLTKQ